MEAPPTSTPNHEEILNSISPEQSSSCQTFLWKGTLLRRSRPPPPPPTPFTCGSNNQPQNNSHFFNLKCFTYKQHYPSTNPLRSFRSHCSVTLEKLTQPPEAEALLGEPEDRRRTLQQQHSLSGISDQPDLTASIRSDTGSLRSFGQGYGAASNNCDPDDGHHHSHIFDHSIHQDIASHSSLRSILLLFALSLHSIFEGMAVGLQDTINDVVALFMVVIFHKGIIAFSLGLNMVQSKLSLSQLAQLLSSPEPHGDKKMRVVLSLMWFLSFLQDQCE
ncbi:hypothetical protein SK128_018588 [Halocaridina rubra]|uniref:Uncharacterized protein n=1 Tax=Halocaridina rubra TaxID=373956 RepID=A0AAN8WSB3_HALRR